MSQHIQHQLASNGVLTLTLDRPEVHNAFGEQLIREMTEALQQAADDPAVRILVLAGAGKSFSAGADMNWMSSMVGASAEENERDAQQLARMLRRLNYFPKPTIARIHGAAFGGGVGLAACCDISIAVDTAQFALTEVRLGLVPAVISPFVFRRIGESQARRYFLTAERFDAATAQTIGLVQLVVTADDLDATLARQIELLLQGGPNALKQAKRLVFSVANHDNTRQRQIDEDNARLIARLRVSEEGQEGLRAFLDKREPAWRHNGSIQTAGQKQDQKPGNND
ncbi:MAG TPA: enoyl-CoA hydratase/isomerase family protein [Xanthomonadales bacterium]|nr:enoyl-CoA hydratase/isomerase family protein [Xanthomonadales bacterium]